MDKRLFRVARKLRAILGVSRVEVEPLPSGIVYLTVWRADRCFGLAYYPKDGFIVYELDDESAFDAGPSEKFSNLDDASARIFEIVRSESRTPAALVG